MASLLVLIVVLVSSVGHLGTARREGPSDGKSLTSFEFSEGTLQQGNPLEFQHHRQLEQDAPSANATDTQAADKEAKKLAKKLGKTAADLVCECLNSEGDSSRAQCTPGGCELPQTSDRITELLK
eukprot:evm.model.scf_1204EXC.3 EVM.evm.TU.scf_1204EXC.3   scf_1204EXC:23632-26923(+)